MGMRYLQLGGVDNQVINSHDIYIHQSVNIMALTVTV